MITASSRHSMVRKDMGTPVSSYDRSRSGSGDERQLQTGSECHDLPFSTTMMSSAMLAREVLRGINPQRIPDGSGQGGGVPGFVNSRFRPSWSMATYVYEASVTMKNASRLSIFTSRKPGFTQTSSLIVTEVLPILVILP